MFNSSAVSIKLICLILITGIAILGCSHTSELYRADLMDESSVDYSVIYYIHADSDYLYHNADGEPVRGNSKVLNTAFRVAGEAKSGEVFVFYQRPEKKIIGLFPRNNSRFYHYKNGELTSHIKYRHSDRSEDFLTTEARLYNQYRTQTVKENQRKYFLYFGHEILDDDGKKYHRTNPDIAVNTGSFTEGIQKFLIKEDQLFNLVVLSTCNNGTPVMADHLISLTDVLLASPQNLHLSHIDSKNLSLMERNPDIPTVQLGHAIADQTYRRLESETKTAITLTVYDFEILRKQTNELRAFSREYDALDSLQNFSDNIDCREAAFFDEGTFREGLIIMYRPGKFGRRASITTHSGWGCKPVIDNGQHR